MEKEIIEEKRNTLNLRIRELLSVIELIDGVSNQYDDYIVNSLNEIQFLEQQSKLITEAKERLINIFKD